MNTKIKTLIIETLAKRLDEYDFSQPHKITIQTMDNVDRVSQFTLGAFTVIEHDETSMNVLANIVLQYIQNGKVLRIVIDKDILWDFDDLGVAHISYGYRHMDASARDKVREIIGNRVEFLYLLNYQGDDHDPTAQEVNKEILESKSINKRLSNIDYLESVADIIAINIDIANSYRVEVSKSLEGVIEALSENN